jgi:hypothetical protein
MKKTIISQTATKLVTWRITSVSPAPQMRLNLHHRLIKKKSAVDVCVSSGQNFYGCTAVRMATSPSGTETLRYTLEMFCSPLSAAEWSFFGDKILVKSITQCHLIRTFDIFFIVPPQTNNLLSWTTSSRVKRLSCLHAPFLSLIQLRYHTEFPQFQPILTFCLLYSLFWDSLLISVQAESDWAMPIQCFVHKPEADLTRYNENKNVWRQQWTYLFWTSIQIKW